MIINALILMNVTTPLIDVTTSPPAPTPWVATHALATLVSLVTDLNALILMNVLIVHAMLPPLVQTPLVHSVVPATPDGPVMDSLVLTGMNVKTDFKDWNKSALIMLSVPILMVTSHVPVILDILVTVSMSVSILTNATLVTITATLMRHAATLTVVLLVPVTMASLVMASLVMMSMNAMVKMNAMPTVHAPIHTEVTLVLVTKVTMATDLSVWTMTNVPTLRTTAVHLMQLAPTLMAHIPAHVILVTETVLMTDSNVSTTMNVLKTPTIVTPMEAVPIPLVASHAHVTLVSLVTELLAVTSTNVMTAHATPTVHAKILSAHLLAHVMMVSKVMDSIAQILMNVQLVLITVTTMLHVKMTSVDSLADVMMDTLVME
jgi:hypothetical protein